MDGDRAPDVRLVLQTLPTSAGVARHVIGGLLPADLPRGRREQILVAISEAVTNAVLHGHHDGGMGELTVVGTRHAEMLELRVLDPGRGMIPELDGRGLGLGLSIVAAAADSMEIRGGAELIIRFAL